MLFSSCRERSRYLSPFRDEHEGELNRVIYLNELLTRHLGLATKRPLAQAFFFTRLLSKETRPIRYGFESRYLVYHLLEEESARI